MLSDDAQAKGRCAWHAGWTWKRHCSCCLCALASHCSTHHAGLPLPALLHSLRVSGVPFFILQSGSSRAYALSGAQPAAAFEEVFEQVLAEGGGANGAVGSTGEESGSGQGAADGCKGGSCGMRGAGKE